MQNVVQLFSRSAPRPTGIAIENCDGTVTEIIHTKQAKAQGVFAQINIAARRMGFSERFAMEYARRARADYNDGHRSAARVISDWTATLRAVNRKVQA